MRIERDEEMKEESNDEEMKDETRQAEIVISNN